MKEIRQKKLFEVLSLTFVDLGPRRESGSFVVVRTSIRFPIPGFEKKIIYRSLPLLKVAVFQCIRGEP